MTFSLSGDDHEPSRSLDENCSECETGNHTPDTKVAWTVNTTYYAPKL